MLGIDVGCKVANAGNGELSGITHAVAYMREMVNGQNVRFRCDCVNAIKKASGAINGVSNLEVARTARAELELLKIKATVRFEKVDQQHSGKGAKDLWQHHVDARCTEALKGAMTKWAFLDSVGTLMRNGEMWELEQGVLNGTPPGPHTVQSDTTRCGDSRVGHPGRAKHTYRFYCVFNLSILLLNAQTMLYCYWMTMHCFYWVIFCHSELSFA
jgi:hypothetical protein